RHRRIAQLNCIVMDCIILDCIVLDRFVMPCPGRKTSLAAFLPGEPRRTNTGHRWMVPAFTARGQQTFHDGIMRLGGSRNRFTSCRRYCAALCGVWMCPTRTARDFCFSAAVGRE